MSAAFGRRHLRIRTLERCCCERRAALCLLWIGARGQRYAFESVKRRGVVLVKFDFRFSIFEFRERATARGRIGHLALTGLLQIDPATRGHGDRPDWPPGPAMVTVANEPHHRPRSIRAGSANANEYPRCALTSGVPLDSRSRSPSGVCCAVHTQPSSTAWGSSAHSRNWIYEISRTATSNASKQTKT